MEFLKDIALLTWEMMKKVRFRQRNFSNRKTWSTVTTISSLNLLTEKLYPQKYDLNYFFFKIFSTEKIFHCFRSLTSYLSKSWLYVTNLTASSSILRFSTSNFRLQELALKLSPRRNCTTQTQRLTVQMNLNPCQLTVTLPLPLSVQLVGLLVLCN